MRSLLLSGLAAGVLGASPDAMSRLRGSSAEKQQPAYRRLSKRTATGSSPAILVCAAGNTVAAADGNCWTEQSAASVASALSANINRISFGALSMPVTTLPSSCVLDLGIVAADLPGIAAQVPALAADATSAGGAGCTFDPSAYQHVFIVTKAALNLGALAPWSANYPHWLDTYASVLSKWAVLPLSDPFTAAGMVGPSSMVGFFTKAALYHMGAPASQTLGGAGDEGVLETFLQSDWSDVMGSASNFITTNALNTHAGIKHGLGWISDASVQTYTGGAASTYTLTAVDGATAPAGGAPITVRIPSAYDVADRYLYLTLRTDAPGLDGASGKTAGVVLHDTSIGYENPIAAAFPAYLTTSLGDSMLVQPRGTPEGYTDVALHAGDAFIYENNKRTDAKAKRILVQVLSINTGVSPPTASVKLTEVTGYGDAAGTYAGPTAVVFSTTTAATVTQSGTLSPGASMAVYSVKLASTLAATDRRTVAVTSCPTGAGGSTVVAAYASFPAAQYFYGADLSVGAFQVSYSTLTAGASDYTADSCGTVWVPANTKTPLYVLVATQRKLAGGDSAAYTLSFSAPSNAASGAATTVQYGVSVYYEIGNTDIGELTTLLPNPAVPLAGSRPVYARRTQWAKVNGWVDAALYYEPGLAKWVQAVNFTTMGTSLAWAINDTSVDVGKTIAAAIVAHHDAAAVTNIRDTAFGGALEGMVGNTPATIVPACPARTYGNLMDRKCTGCMAYGTTTAGTSSCGCELGTTLSTDRASCSVCPAGSVIRAGVCAPCPGYTAVGPAGSFFGVCTTATCPKLKVTTVNGTTELDGTYSLQTTTVRGWPYWQADAGATPVKFVYRAYPDGAWLFQRTIDDDSTTVGMLMASVPRIPDGVTNVKDSLDAGRFSFLVPSSPDTTITKWECLTDAGAAANPVTSLPLVTPPGTSCHSLYYRSALTGGCEPCSVEWGPSYVQDPTNEYACVCPPAYMFENGCGFPSSFSIYSGAGALSGMYVHVANRPATILTIQGGSWSGAPNAGSAYVPVFQLVSSTTSSTTNVRMLGAAASSSTPVFLMLDTATNAWTFTTSYTNPNAPKLAVIQTASTGSGPAPLPVQPPATSGASAASVPISIAMVDPATGALGTVVQATSAVPANAAPSSANNFDVYQVLGLDPSDVGALPTSVLQQIVSTALTLSAPTAAAPAAASSSSSSLSGGAVAGIVVGSVAGLALLGALLRYVTATSPAAAMAKAGKTTTTSFRTLAVPAAGPASAPVVVRAPTYGMAKVGGGSARAVSPSKKAGFVFPPGYEATLPAQMQRGPSAASMSPYPSYANVYAASPMAAAAAAGAGSPSRSGSSRVLAAAPSVRGPAPRYY